MWFFRSITIAPPPFYEIPLQHVAKANCPQILKKIDPLTKFHQSSSICFSFTHNKIPFLKYWKDIKNPMVPSTKISNASQKHNCLQILKRKKIQSFRKISSRSILLHRLSVSFLDAYYTQPKVFSTPSIPDNLPIGTKGVAITKSWPR